MSTRRILLTAVFLAACSIPAVAQTETPAATPPAAAPAVTVAGATPVAAPVTRDKDTLSVDFPDEDIKTILRNVADLFELNLVVPDTLTGKTSIKLRDVSWRQIFQVVLSPVGFTYIEEGNIIKIVSNELMQLEPGTTEVFVLNNAKASDIKPTIDGLIDAAKGGKIVVDARSNSLVITERPTQLKRIAGIIAQLDKATDQVMIESKFVEVTDRDIRNIGVNWASLQGMQFGVRGVSQRFDRRRDQQENNGNNTSGTTNKGTTGSSNNGTSNNTSNNTSNGNSVTYVTSPILPAGGQSPNFATGTLNLPSGSVTGLSPTTVPSVAQVVGFTPFVAGTPAIPATGATILGGIVVPGTAAVAAVPDRLATFTAPNTLTGSNTVTTTGSVTDAIANSVSSSVNNAITSLTGLTNTGGTSRLATAVFSSSDFNVIISALKQQNNTKIVSNPTIVTLNNTEATLNIGEEFPVPNYTYNSVTGSFEVSGFTYKPIGVILKVTPQVNARGVIKMTIEPEVSQRNGATSFGGAGGAQIPIIATRKVKTQVSLTDGYTMGIGGLITNSTDHGGSRVPILGDIPVLGRLFSSKNVNDISTNLLIFITAKTVSSDGASPEQVFDPRAVQAVGMSREDLPGYRAAKGADLYAPAPEKKQ